MINGILVFVVLIFTFAALYSVIGGWLVQRSLDEIMKEDKREPIYPKWPGE